MGRAHLELDSRPSLWAGGQQGLGLGLQTEPLTRPAGGHLADGAQGASEVCPAVHHSMGVLATHTHCASPCS